MTEAEFQDWVDMFCEHPFDDYHRYQRPAALIASSAATSFGGDIQPVLDSHLDWLVPGPPAPDGDGFTSADRDLFAAAGIKRTGRTT